MSPKIKAPGQKIAMEEKIRVRSLLLEPILDRPIENGKGMTTASRGCQPNFFILMLQVFPLTVNKVKMEQRPSLMIIKPGALGDTVLTLPCIIALKPIYRIMFVGTGPGLFWISKYVDNVFNFEMAPWNQLFVENTHPFLNTVPFVPDIIVCFTSAYKEIVSSNLKEIFSGSNVTICSSIPDRRVHITKYIYSVLKGAGVKIEWDMVVEQLKNGLIDKMPPGKYMVIHPGSGSKRKNYPMEFWLKLALRLKELPFGKRVLFMFGPAEEKEFSSWEGRLKFRGLEAVLSESPRDLMEILHKAMFFLGHDSGPTHLASVMGIPTFGFFKLSDLKVWRPVGPCAFAIRLNDPERLINTALRLITHVFDGSKNLVWCGKEKAWRPFFE